MKKSLVSAGIVVLVVSLQACLWRGKPLELKARDSIASAGAVLKVLIERHEGQCIQDPTKAPCPFIKKAAATINLVNDALVIYCSGTPQPGTKPFREGGPCVAQGGLSPRLEASLKELRVIQRDLNTLFY
jgi:hypothetical protein